MSVSLGTSLLTGFGGDAGFGDAVSIGRNDDQVTPPFDISAVFANGMNFFGQAYSSFYISNNGRITFSAPDGTFTPSAITASTSNPQIDAFFADVDTRLPDSVTTALTPTPGGTSTGSDMVYTALDTVNHRVVITWDDVGYFATHTDKLNAFQMVLTDRSAGGSPGDFDIQFRYEAVNWTTGDASNGHNGLGGVIARAGYSAGTGDSTQYFELPESGIQGGDGQTVGMLDLASADGNTGIPGLWNFSVRNGVVYTPPSVDVGNQDATLVEAGLNTSGVANATIGLTVLNGTSAGTTAYDTSGWTASLQPGIFTENGVYGVATLNTNTNTISYALDNSRAATNALHAGQVVTDNFAIGASDGQTSSSSTAAFVIDGSNDAPVAGNDALSVTAGQTVSVTTASLLANDTDVDAGDVLTLTGVGNAVHGAVSLVNGQVRFVADGNYTGNAAGFQYTIADGNGGTATGTVGVTVAAGQPTPPTPPNPNGSRYIVLTNGADDKDYTSSPGAVLVVAGDGDDRVVGSAFNDSLNGGAGNDRLVGGAGNDVITGGAGADRMQGGTGNDTFVFDVGDLMPSTASLDQIIDFHGAGRIDGPENDFLMFKGFDAGTTLQFDHAAAGNAALQYYKVTDSVNASRSGMLLVQMADGNAHLAAGDYSFTA